MRVMVMVKATKNSEAGLMPGDPKAPPGYERLLEEMGKFNEEMVKAGVMLAGEGLHPSSKGARVFFKGGKTTVVDGPFAETKELIAGFWLIQVKSKDEAIAWARKCPAPHGEGVETHLELRQVFEDEEFGGEVAEKEAALRQAIKDNQERKQ